MRRAVFLDRDGTLVEARHYPSRPEQLVLYEGVAAELARLQAVGFLLVVVTNQSGIARALFTEADLARMHDHLRRQLELQGVAVDAVYYCPHHHDGIVPGLDVACDCRKPSPGMLLRAAEDLDIDLAHSWFVGDILDDIEAGNRAGCRTVLADIGSESAPATPLRMPDYVGSGTVHALRIIAAVEGLSSYADLDYTPDRWRLAGGTHAHAH